MNSALCISACKKNIYNNASALVCVCIIIIIISLVFNFKSSLSMKYKDEHVHNGQYQNDCSNFTLNNLDRETSPNLIIQ